MNNIDTNELWRLVPPEEKFDLISKSHAQGFQVGAITVLVGCTVAVGLQIQALIWISLIISPMLFQFAAGKAWRDLKPRLMLEYLAARSATRRFAFSVQSRDLSLAYLFRGILEFEFDQEHLQDSLAARVEDASVSQVWVALFNDAVVMMTERFGGGELKFGHLLNSELLTESTSPSGDSDYSNQRAVRFFYKDRTGEKRQAKLISKHPAALIVFEKKLAVTHRTNLLRLEEQKRLAEESTKESQKKIAASDPSEEPDISKWSFSDAE